MTAIRAGRERDQRSITDQFIPTTRARQALSRTPAVSRGFFNGRSGDFGNWVIGQRQADVRRPAREIERRTAVLHLRRPHSQVLEDAPNDSRILDQRNDPLQPLALGALQRIDLVDLADQPRPGGFCSSRKFSRRLRAWRRQSGAGLGRNFLRALAGSFFSSSIATNGTPSIAYARR